MDVRRAKCFLIPKRRQITSYSLIKKAFWKRTGKLPFGVIIANFVVDIMLPVADQKLRERRWTREIKL
jgi:hypothetical protein